MAFATANNYDNDSILTTKAPAVFQPLQSWFQFKFADEDGKPISVASLVITSDKYIFTDEYSPFSPDNKEYCTNEIYITPMRPTDDYIYADIRFGESCTDDDILTFTVTDAEGNDYKGTKPVPKGGFEKGKRYIEPTAIRLTKHFTRVKPTIDWNNVSEKEPSPTTHRYDVVGNIIALPEGSFDAVFDSPSITISGKSDGYCFYMCDHPTVTLNNLTATYNDTGLNRFLDEGFIFSSDGLHVIINGTNSIVCKDSRACITTQGSLKISGNGTLSVTVNDAAYKGLLGERNYDKSDNSSTDNLADYNTGDVVVLKSKTKNDDGTWTFTYEVTNASH